MNKPLLIPRREDIVIDQFFTISELTLELNEISKRNDVDIKEILINSYAKYGDYIGFYAEFTTPATKEELKEILKTDELKKTRAERKRLDTYLELKKEFGVI